MSRGGDVVGGDEKGGDVNLYELLAIETSSVILLNSDCTSGSASHESSISCSGSG